VSSPGDGLPTFSPMPNRGDVRFLASHLHEQRLALVTRLDLVTHRDQSDEIVEQRPLRIAQIVDSPRTRQGQLRGE